MKKLLTLLAILYLIVLYLWTAGAFYYDVGQRGWTGWLCLVIWTVAFVLILVYVKPFWVAVIAITVVVAGVIGWWLTLKPSNDRQWDPNFEKLANISVNGDELTVHDLRYTHYRSLTDYDRRYESRTYRFSDLKAVDVLILDWGAKVASHPIVIFDFGNDQHLCFSIEVRYRLGEKYELLPNLYRQNEIIYVVSDERDAILQRTKYSIDHYCYLYRLQRTREQLLQLLHEYIEQTNELFEKPGWYNILTSNCTTSIYRYRHDKLSWDWRIVFNGQLDKMLYEWGRLYQGMPFEELKKVSCINERANAASRASFHSDIRQGLPGFESSD